MLKKKKVQEFHPMAKKRMKLKKNISTPDFLT